jgi:diguanylate cyclase (GGDEF)-like protein
MKEQIPNGARHAAAAARRGTQRPRGAPRGGAAGSAPARLEQALSALAELNRAFAMSQHRLRTAEQRIETLGKRDSRIRQKFLRLAQEAAQVRHIAYHDELTGLPNRSLLFDRFTQAVARAARQDTQVALLFLDLDGFKRVNDRFGHAAGDKLLQQVAGRLSACIRASDTACRYGGDEFVVMLPQVDRQESAAAVAEKIRAGFAAPFVVDASTITLTASIGTAVYPIDGRSYRDLIHQSDIGMYRRKARSSAPPSLPETASKAN